MKTAEEPKVEVAFTDARRFSRVRLVHCAAQDIRITTPLKENGPDPTLDQSILTEEWLEKKMKSKHVPVKALLLDQANISGIGNWVGDEILYHAKLHPEQYSDTFSSAQLKQLHTSIMHICNTAVDLLADSSKFPDEWLFKHRWGKGKKDSPTMLPNGAKITFLTVGGRTSCVVPSVQKKTGAVAGDLKREDGGSRESVTQGLVSKKRKVTEEEANVEDSHVKAEVTPSSGVKGRALKKKSAVVEEIDEGVKRPNAVKEEDRPKSNTKKRKASTKATAEKTNSKVNGTPGTKKEEKPEAPAAPSGRRRSGRVSEKPA